MEETISRAIQIVLQTNRFLTDFKRDLPVDVFDAAVQNMLLAVTALGYATVWLDGVLRVDEVATRLNSLLDIPQGKTIQVVLPLGVAVAQGKRPEKLAFEKRAWFNRYEG